MDRAALQERTIRGWLVLGYPLFALLAIILLLAGFVLLVVTMGMAILAVGRGEVSLPMKTIRSSLVGLLGLGVAAVAGFVALMVQWAPLIAAADRNPAGADLIGATLPTFAVAALVGYAVGALVVYLVVRPRSAAPRHS